MFEGIWEELESKTVFQRQSVTKYLRLTLVFMKNSAPRETFDCYFWDFFASTSKISILAGGLGTGLSFYEV